MELLNLKKSTFTLAKGSKCVTTFKDNRKNAFTLAEVLITLGVIGVVAAITIAPLVHKYKIKQYETAFKKTNANLQNAINLALQDSGYQKINDISQLCAGQGTYAPEPCKSESKAELQRLWNNVLSNLNVVKKQYGGFGTPYGLGGFVKTVAGVDSNLYYMQLNGANGCIAILNDGSSVGCRPELHVQQNGDMYYAFDTNGPKKGPNRIGYDVFVVPFNRYTSSCPINNTTNSANSSYGCYWYALRNQSLDDVSKNYWESLK